ncbi:D-lactate dehydrogenase [Psychrobacter sp. CAL346-MNA-CIBAN-0220]|uniref:D-lactate dehydrogenase n=1 Tax=Psychrobacter sp. CAL346-MNA-CIBAN-0220 TaxID=3140457 RepID=UPI00332C8E56
MLTKLSQQQAYVHGIINDDAAPQVLAVIVPQSLVALWRVINICAAADAIIIAQAANTGLTGGSTPFGDYDRPVVVISMQLLGGIHLLNDATEAIALPAATLQQLDSILTPMGREPHSVLGSSCVGASVIGGICNSSGGMLVQRGPAYTEMALYARRSSSGTFELINHLGLALGDTPEEILNNLQSGQFGEVVQVDDEIDSQIDVQVKSQIDKSLDSATADRASANYHYQNKVRDCESATPARYNNDPSGLFEASGSAGKLIVFAVRVATFAKTTQEQTFYISTDQAEALTTLRQKWLKSDLSLPVLAEYMHKDYNDITLHYGRDTCLSMSRLTASKIGALYRLQAKVGYYLEKWHLPQTLSDRLLQLASTFMPASLPKPLARQSRAYNYHLIIKVADDNICTAQEFLQSHMQHYDGTLHACTPKEGAALLVFRSAATAAMFRYHNLNHKDFGELISTDIALPRNAIDWDEILPTDLQQQVKNCFYLGHFFCHVMHQDYLLHPDVDAKTFKEELLNFYDQRHIEYPAEHNVGHVYSAKSALNSFYKKLDPTNSLNPGIGQTAKWKNWRSTPFMEE